ncbi:hypothetical protein RRG08_018220 [Elysia crispata]|uniref:Uncharacterized protein n=1 Tax=Elysia crispata TaxID=231223 RepID=A0AAE0YJU7_9GAST|nr:hypothetical protein RRG08_018220 [Elysia crispata]
MASRIMKFFFLTHTIFDSDHTGRQHSTLGRKRWAFVKQGSGQYWSVLVVIGHAYLHGTSDRPATSSVHTPTHPLPYPARPSLLHTLSHLLRPHPNPSPPLSCTPLPSHSKPPPSFHTPTHPLPSLARPSLHTLSHPPPSTPQPIPSLIMHIPTHPLTHNASPNPGDGGITLCVYPGVTSISS